MSQYSTSILVALWCSVIIPGCIVPFGKVYERAPDPEEGSFVTVVEVLGKTLKLADGRQFELTGLDLSDLTGRERSSCQGAILAAVLEQPRLLLVNEKGNRARIEESYYRMPRSGVVILFPRIAKVMPRRSDLGERIIANGYAKASIEEIDDPHLREKYVAAESYAKKKKVGIWARTSRVKNRTPAANPPAGS